MLTLSKVQTSTDGMVASCVILVSYVLNGNGAHFAIKKKIIGGLELALSRSRVIPVHLNTG